MRELRRGFAQAHAMRPLRNAPFERRLWGWDTSNSLVWRGLEATTRLLSPARSIPPSGRSAITRCGPSSPDLIEPALLAAPAAPPASGVTVP
jgi:hypothetical protein